MAADTTLKTRVSFDFSAERGAITILDKPASKLPKYRAANSRVQRLSAATETSQPPLLKARGINPVKAATFLLRLLISHSS